MFGLPSETHLKCQFFFVFLIVRFNFLLSSQFLENVLILVLKAIEKASEVIVLLSHLFKLSQTILVFFHPLRILLISLSLFQLFLNKSNNTLCLLMYSLSFAISALRPSSSDIFSVNSFI